MSTKSNHPKKFIDLTEFYNDDSEKMTFERTTTGLSEEESKRIVAEVFGQFEEDDV